MLNRPPFLPRGAAAVLALAGLCALCSAACATPETPSAARLAADLPAAPAAAPRIAPEEARALWVVRSSLTSPAAIRTIVAQARDNGYNTLIVQARGRGELFCAGGLEPRAGELAAQPLEFDPLEQIVREGHAAGLQVHAWINALFVWSRPQPPASAGHIVHAHPDWLMVNRAGRKVSAGDNVGVFTCPSHPGVRRHLHDLVLDLARRYDLDGVQFDFIRYPGADYCYCMGCLTRFKREANRALPPTLRSSLARRPGRLVYPQVLSRRWAAWRREQITSLVRWIYQDLKALRPALVVSADVIAWGGYNPDFRKSAAYAVVGQDWYGWLREGILDVAVPMTYQTSTAAFGRWVRGVRRDQPQATVWFGIGAYLFPPRSTAAQIAAVREAGAAGWSLFSYSAVTREGRDDSYLRALRDRVGAPVARAAPAPPHARTLSAPAAAGTPLRSTSTGTGDGAEASPRALQKSVGSEK